MDKNEPIENGDEPESNHGRGSFDADAQDTKASSVEDEHGSEPAPPPPPPPPPETDVDVAADPGSDVTLDTEAGAAADESAAIIEPPTFTGDKSPAREPEPAAAAAVTEASTGDTRLIDLGEAIADENSREKPAPWKYALALGLPILVAIGLIALLAGRGGDDEPEFTVADSTELAVDGDTSADTESASEPAATTAADDDATKILSDAETVDDEADPDETAEQNETVEVDGTGDDSDGDTSQADPDADDEPNVAPTEAPEPTLEPEATATPEPTTASQSANDNDDNDDADDGDNPFSVGGSTQLGDSDSADGDNNAAADPTATASPTAEPTSGSGNDPEPTTAPTETPTTAPTTTPTSTATSGSTSGSGSATAGDLRTFTDLDAFSELYPGIAPAASDYDAYNKVTDDTGALSMWVPTAFTFIDSEPDPEGAKLAAGAEQGLSLDVSGVELRLHIDGNLDEILAEHGPAFVADCTVLTGGYELPADLEYQGLLYAEELNGDDGVDGAYIIYESCLFGNEPTSIIEVALQNEDDDVALIRMQVASMADLGALDTILRSLDF